MARHEQFYKRTLRACSDSALGQKLYAATDRPFKAREVICEELGDVEKFRDLAANLRDDVLSNLESYLSKFVEKLERSGVHVHWANDAQDARDIICQVAKDYDVSSIVKSKSMVTEEIELIAALECEGIEVTETDLGEFIIQLTGQRPSHIVLPAIHLSVAEVAEVFREKIGYDGAPEAESLTKAARQYLRGKFKAAQMGISGVNFAISEQGLWTVCTNEGNGRYVMGLPRVYLGVMGIERIVQDADSAAVVLKMLGKFATGQRITQYVNIVKGPGAVNGPEHVHLVILDNGRNQILGTKYWKMLRCIRCGACLNACPVFKHIGGQSFPGCYSGPMGMVLLPLLMGLKKTGSLPKACSLCSICSEICPVKIPLPDLILELRNDLVRTGYCSILEKMAMAAGAWVLQHPMLYRLGQRVIRLGLRPASKAGWVKWLPSIPGQWTKVKDLPLPAKKSFLSEENANDRSRNRSFSREK